MAASDDFAQGSVYISYPHGPVSLRRPGESPLVCGYEVDPLSPAQWDVITALISAGSKGLSLSELLDSTGFSDARGILRRLRLGNDHWAGVIRMAGRAFGRYRIEWPISCGEDPRTKVEAVLEIDTLNRSMEDDAAEIARLTARIMLSARRVSELLDYGKLSPDGVQRSGDDF
jgi:hypothetical protein